MSYAKLGMSCKSMTIACTSNHKYLSPSDAVYFRRRTNMMQYPAKIVQGQFCCENIDQSKTMPCGRKLAEYSHQHPKVSTNVIGGSGCLGCSSL